MDCDYQKLLVGINGFGVIGRIIFRELQKRENIQVAKINDLAPRENLEYLLRNDSSHGRNQSSLEGVELTQEKEVGNQHWDNIDVVVDSTPHLREYEQLRSHLDRGAGYVLRTSPLKGSPIQAQTIVVGVNDHSLDLDKYRIFSLASCTTNCLAPLIKAVRDYCSQTGNEIESLDFVTVHAYTSDQCIKDGLHKSDLRRGRDVNNILETETGASSQIRLIFPELEGKIHGSAYRVPVPNGSVLELRVAAKNRMVLSELNAFIKRASQQGLRGVLSYEVDPLVSSDCLNNPHSCVYCEAAGEQLTSNKIKLGALYDNEFGYSQRVVDLISRVKKEKYESLRMKF